MVAILALAALVAGGCGSRRSQDDLAAAAGARAAAGTDAAALDGALDGVDAVAGEGAVGDDAGPVGGNERAGTGVDAARGPGTAAPDAAGARTAPAGAAAPAAGATIRIGVVGTMSGVGGTQLASTRAVQAWAQARNRSGGVNGRPIEAIVVDDGGDPARFRAALQDLVERRNVVAFVGALTGFSISEGAVKYLEEKRVPIIGGDRLSAMWNTSPMLFPQASAGDAVIWNHSVNTARLAGKGAAVGWVTCQEAQICRDADRLWQQYLPALGLQVKYRATVSVAQPGFTAECASARQAGVQVFLLGTDSNSTRRIATDCAKQGYTPRFGVLQTSDEMAAEPALDGGFYGSATFPWVLDDSPATKEFAETMKRYAPNVTLSAHAASGWVAAKLFERVAGGLGTDVTTPRLLEALWKLENETLGGLTAPLTYVKNKGAPPTYCYFGMVITGRAWEAAPREMLCRAP